MTKITIIIPTYNRPHCLKRILNYYYSFIELPKEAKMKDDFEFIVADSSSPENKIKNKEIISRFCDLNIRHIKNYPEEMNPWHKFADAVKYAKNEYCLFCSDDDFVFPKSVVFCADFLRNNSSFAAAHGHYIMFRLEEKGGGKAFWLSDNSLESITNSRAEIRLKEHLSNYILPTFSALHRTKLLQMALEETTKFTNDNRFGELLPSMLVPIYGKIKCFDLPYAVQEMNVGSVGTTTETLEDFIKEGSYEEKYRKFRGCLSTNLSLNSKLSREESEKIIDLAMADYLGKNYPKSLKSSFFKKMKAILPQKIYKTIKSIYIKNRFSKLKDNFSVLAESPSFEYREEFEKIKNCIMSCGKI
ncbi:MAG: TIGR00180 family glycosyltransferase [bacterium]|nr:TIGR00180 family glycosyltransferase [bacterium]